MSFPRLRDKLLGFQAEKSSQQEKLSFRLYDVWFPESWWYFVYSECSAQRLFFPVLLPDVDKLLYLDSDILFLSNVNDIWKHFSLMNASQALAMAPDGCQGYTLKSNKVPHYGYQGLNSGVLLMNLAQMRHMDFSNEMRMIYDGFKDRIRYVDQDILNIYFHYHPQFLYLLPCEFNFGYPYCYNSDACRCKNAEKFGISLLHGFSNMFAPKMSHYFGRIYNAFSKHNASKRKLGDLLTQLKRTHRNLDGKLGACSKMNATIFGRFENYIQQHAATYLVL
jgi:UDP-xylose:glucoside alpha-1,3-xylosyltransferase